MAAKKTPAAVKKTAAKKPSTPDPVKQARLQENLENRVFNDLIKRYTGVRDFDMVEDLLDVYGRLLHDREDEQS